MKKCGIIVGLFLCFVLCGCQKSDMDVDQNVLQENEQAYPEAYDSFCEQESIDKVALIYLDEDAIPELLTIQKGEYKIYTVQDDAVEEIDFKFCFDKIMRLCVP